METDKFIESLAKYGEETAAVIGFIAKAEQKGRYRVHPSADPHVYVEFDEADILHTHSLPTSVSPLGGAVVILKHNAKVEQVKGDRKTVERDFLAGEIATGAMKIAGPPASGIFWTTITTTTATTIPLTATYFIGCFTDWICETGTMRCMGTVFGCPDNLAIIPGPMSMGCPSNYCPSEGSNCPTIGCGDDGGKGNI